MSRSDNNQESTNKATIDEQSFNCNSNILRAHHLRDYLGKNQPVFGHSNSLNFQINKNCQSTQANTDVNNNNTNSLIDYSMPYTTMNMSYSPIREDGTVYKSDWVCPDPRCMYFNFGRRFNCNKCGYFRPKGAENFKPEMTEIRNPVKFKMTQLNQLSRSNMDLSDKWLCKICKNVNFPGKEICQRCGDNRNNIISK